LSIAPHPGQRLERQIDLVGILLLFLLSFLLLGPKKTSELARLVGQQVANLKAVASDLQAQLVDEVSRQAISTTPNDQAKSTIVDLVTSGITFSENDLQAPTISPPTAELIPNLSPASPCGSADCGIGESH
jgi:Sec-independent protein translocase protein TatA